VRESGRACRGGHVEALGRGRLAAHRARQGVCRLGGRTPQGDASRLLPGDPRLHRHAGLRPLRAGGGPLADPPGDRRGARAADRAAAGRDGHGRRVREPHRGNEAVVSRIDPITLGVVWGALQSIAVEIGTTVHRTAYSEQAREGQDFSVAVFDPAGRMVAQGPYSPGHMGAMSFAVRNGLAAHPVETLRPGDAILLNDPLLGSGHLPDFFVTQPAFHDGLLVGFAVNIVHQTDVGGSRPGSQGVEGIFDYFQEGLRIPPTKVWREYQEDSGVVGIIAANTRTPDKVLGDMLAQRSALRVGELRLIELVQRYGRERVLAAMGEIIARSEASVRAAIARIPDGVYTFEDFLDDYGPETEPLRVHVTVTVAGDGVTIDYAGSSPQTPSGM